MKMRQIIAKNMMMWLSYTKHFVHSYILDFTISYKTLDLCF